MTTKQVSLAVGEFAIQELARLREVNAELRAALELLHDNIAEYARINNLGGFDNHDMKMARAALTKSKEATWTTCTPPSRQRRCRVASRFTRARVSVYFIVILANRKLKSSAKGSGIAAPMTR